MASTNRKAARGAILVILASLIFGITPTIQERVMSMGTAPHAVTVSIFAVCAVLSLLIVKIQNLNLRITGVQYLWIVLIGVVGMGMTNLFLNIAYTYIPVGLVTMLYYSYPCVVCVLMTVFFKEGFTWIKLSAIVCAAAGLLMLGGETGRASLVGVLAAVSACITFCLFMIGNDKSCIAGLPEPVKTFYMSVAILVVFSICALVTGADFPTQTAEWLLNALQAVMFSAAFYLLVAGVPLAGAAVSSFLCIAEPVTSVVFSSAVLRYALGSKDITGCVIMVISLLLITIGGAQLEKRKRAQS